MSGRTRPLLLGRLRGFGARSANSAPPSCSTCSISTRPRIARRRRTPVGCGAASTSPPASSPHPGCCSWTDPPAAPPTPCLQGREQGRPRTAPFRKSAGRDPVACCSVPSSTARCCLVRSRLGHVVGTAAPRRSARRAGRCAAAAFAGGSGSLPSPTPGPPGCGSTTFGPPPPHSRRPAAQACAPMARIGHASAAATLRLRGTGRARHSGRRSRAVELVRTPVADSITSIGSG